jgi:hypothetical protein
VVRGPLRQRYPTARTKKTAILGRGQENQMAISYRSDEPDPSRFAVEGRPAGAPQRGSVAKMKPPVMWPAGPRPGGKTKTQIGTRPGQRGVTTTYPGGSFTGSMTFTSLPQTAGPLRPRRS